MVDISKAKKTHKDMKNPTRLHECHDYHGNVDGKGQRPLEVVGGQRHRAGGAQLGGAGGTQVRSRDLCPSLKPLQITIL